MIPKVLLRVILYKLLKKSETKFKGKYLLHTVIDPQLSVHFTRLSTRTICNDVLQSGGISNVLSSLEKERC